MIMIERDEQLPRAAAELEQLASYYDFHDTSAEMEHGTWVEPQPMATTSLRLPADVISQLKRQAQARHIRYTAYVRSILERAADGIWNAEDKDKARTAVKAFAKAYGAKFPKAVAKITGSEEELLAFYDYPAEHWVHLRTTNPIESTFATVRHRTKVTKGPGSKAAGLAMAYKLIESTQRRWRAVNAPHLVALVRAGATFVKGKLVERPEDQEPADSGSSPTATDSGLPAAA